MKHYIGFPDPLNPLPYLQAAQLFHNPAEQCMLEKITMGQLYFDLKNLRVVGARLIYLHDSYKNETFDAGYDKPRHFNHLQFASFRIRIYRINDAGHPAEDLCNKEINIAAENSDKIEADLSKYKIIVPKGDFFVAVQWLPTIDNASQIAYSTFSTTKMTGFKPFIGLQPINGEERTFLVKDYSGNWQPSPDKAKLAIAVMGRTE